jgi:hypothetical protein
VSADLYRAQKNSWIRYGLNKDNLEKKIMLESGMIIHIAQNGWHCFDFKDGGHWVPLLFPSSAKGEGN